METKYNKLSECNYEVVITIPYNEMTNDFEEAYVKERKEITYPGFRKGKVPMSIMKRVFKNDIEISTVQKKSDKYIEEALKNSEYQTLNKHILKDIKIEENIDLIVDIEVVPVLELKDYKNLEIEKKNYVIADTYVEGVIKDISKKDASFEKADLIETKEYVAVVEPIDEEKYSDEDYTLLEDMQKAYIDLSKSVENFAMDTTDFAFDISSPGLKKSVTDLFVSKKAGDIIEIIEKHEHGEGEHKHVHEAKVILKVKQMFKIIFPELTEEKIAEYSNNKSKTVEEFKNLILTDYTNYYKKLSEDEARNNLIIKILENNQFELPYRFVGDTLNHLIVKQRKELSAQNYPAFSDDVLANALYPRAIQQVQWYLVAKNIARLENINFSDAELDEMIQKQHEKTGISIDKLKAYYKESNRASEELDAKILKFVEENNTFVSKDVELKGE